MLFGLFIRLIGDNVIHTCIAEANSRHRLSCPILITHLLNSLSPMDWKLCHSPVLRKKKTDHVFPKHRSLHWLPVPQRIQCKIDTPCYKYKCIHVSTPTYICDTVHLYSDRHAPSAQHQILSASEPHASNFYCWFLFFFRLWSFCLEQTPSISPLNTYSDHI